MTDALRLNPVDSGCPMCGGTGGWPGAPGKGWVVCKACKGGAVDNPETPEEMARFCAVHMNVDHGEQLQQEIAKVCSRYRISLATQMMALGGILGELEVAAPTKGLIAPTVARLIRNHVEAAAHIGNLPFGRA